jgi:hypothetical protein
MKNTFVCFVSPLHDPEARLEELLVRHGKDLVRLYDNNVVVSVTDTTSPKIFALLDSFHIFYEKHHKQTAIDVGGNVRNALRLGLTYEMPQLHFIDFDRALHWMKRFPEEYAEVVGKISVMSGYISFVRTQKAFASHPLTQRLTEATINAIVEEIAGVGVDIMSGSFALERHIASTLIAESQCTDYGIYAEFFKLIMKQKVPLSTIEVKGLEWETADQFKKEIDQQGYDVWYDGFQSLQEWKKRVRIIIDSENQLLG